jgi:CubicO group peptidase (beta-lactamase class C family)
VGLSEGFATEQFQGVRDLFDQHLAEGKDLGASVAVHHRGEVVVDIWGGYCDTARTVPWGRDTIVNVWSSTKTMTFLAALMLMDRGELDFDEPVATYWPQFAANGKADVRVRHLLAHSAGLSGWTEALKPEDLADWERCTSALAAQAPWWTPGSQSGYHAVTQGYLLGELVRRITGQSFGTFFRTEIAEPLGADFHIGLSEADEPRVSLVVPPPLPDFSGLDPSSIMVRTLTSPALNATYPHHRWWRAAEIPAANGHGNARSVALIQSIITNGGETAGRRFLRRESVERVFQTEADGTDLVLGVPMRFGAGYGLGSETVPLGPRACFWGGFGGSVIIMDQDSELTVSYMMNQMEVGLIGDTRGMMIAITAAGAALAG